MVSPTDITFFNLPSKVEGFLASIGRKYYRDVRKERNALNEFMLQRVQPKEVFELVKKLVAVRNHQNNQKDKFWIGATENIYGALAYKNQIETVYDSLFAEEIKKEAEKAAKNWETFLTWAKKSLPPTTANELSSLKIKTLLLHDLDDNNKTIVTNEILVYSCNDTLWRFIEAYFFDSGWKVGRVV
ncbi:MAG: hypothetical protein HS129_15250 [Leptospiraceae bacterium]|nr:hypothetical protein [Leptospiraceae bacterium]NUM40829.1 hypothetical protein [Leptospiraceae bacterium]